MVKRAKHRGLFAHLAEDVCPAAAADVGGDGEGAERARTLGMHAAFGNDLAVEVGQFFQQPDIFHQQRAARTGGLAVLGVHHRGAEGGGLVAGRQVARMLALGGVQPALQGCPRLGRWCRLIGATVVVLLTHHIRSIWQGAG